MAGASQVNEFYLDNVMVVAEDRLIEASEDIYSTSGMKLVAKGNKIEGRIRERLLEHTLTKPLEDCLAVADGVTAAHCIAVAERLLARHPVLRALCGQDPDGPLAVLAQASFGGRLQTLMTVYNEHRAGKIDHAMCVALIAMSLLHRLPDHDQHSLAVMLVAGLAHDVGELYINPSYLDGSHRLSTQEWRHIMTHPVIAHDLLKDLSGLAPEAAALIADHHERLDGFGYPVGHKQPPPDVPAQILGVAEMLAGLLDKGHSFLQHASVATKLIHGEFSRPVIDVVSKAYHDCQVEDEALMDAQGLEETLQTSKAVAERMHQVMEVQATVAALVQKASPAFRQLWAQALERFERIKRAWSSTGLDVQPDGSWLLQESPAMQREVAIVLMEVRWRLRELDREMRSRVSIKAPGELPLLERYLQEVQRRVGEVVLPPEPPVATAAP
jgi:hypothetical protein